jgi:dTDP-3-amino-3,4,6-trideoxy-alpha-D-glucose transaminase
LQAAILNAKLPHLDADNARRIAIARQYARALADVPLGLPSMPSEQGHVYHLYVVKCEERDRLRAHLAAEGISSAVHYSVPIHRQRGYAERAIVPADGLPVTEKLAARIISLPIYPGLSAVEVDRVIASIRRFYAPPR